MDSPDSVTRRSHIGGGGGRRLDMHCNPCRWNAGIYLYIHTPCRGHRQFPQGQWQSAKQPAEKAADALVFRLAYSSSIDRFARSAQSRPPATRYQPEPVRRYSPIHRRAGGASVQLATHPQIASLSKSGVSRAYFQHANVWRSHSAGRHEPLPRTPARQEQKQCHQYFVCKS